MLINTTFSSVLTVGTHKIANAKREKFLGVRLDSEFSELPFDSQRFAKKQVVNFVR